jgi:heme exporter protein B
LESGAVSTRISRTDSPDRRLTRLLHQIGAIIRKDLAMEMRSRERFVSMLIFALLVVLIFSFTLDLRAQDVVSVAPGVLWVSFGFAGMLGLGRSFVREREEGCLDGLLLCPIERSAIYVAKMIDNVILISAMQMITLPIFLALFNLPFVVLMLPVMLLGAMGLAAMGTLLAAMMVHARTSDLLLPILFFPVVIPILIAVARLSAGLIAGQPWAEIGHWLHFAIGFNTILLTVSYLCFDDVIEE